MVGLHVLHNQIIGLALTQRLVQIVQPLKLKVAVNRIHHGDFLVTDHIGVVCHAVGNHILTLKQVDFVVVHTNIDDVVCHFHRKTSFFA